MSSTEQLKRKSRDINTMHITPIGSDGTRGETETVELPNFAARHNAGPNTEGVKFFDSRPLLDSTVPKHVVFGRPDMVVSILLDKDNKGGVNLPEQEIRMHVPNADRPPRRNRWDLESVPESGHQTKEERDQASDSVSMAPEIVKHTKKNGEEVVEIAM